MEENSEEIEQEESFEDPDMLGKLLIKASAAGST